MNKYKLLLLFHWPFILFAVTVWFGMLPINEVLVIPMLKWLLWYYIMMMPIIFGVWYENTKESVQK